MFQERHICCEKKMKRGSFNWLNSGSEQKIKFDSWRTWWHFEDIRIERLATHNVTQRGFSSSRLSNDKKFLPSIVDDIFGVFLKFRFYTLHVVFTRMSNFLLEKFQNLKKKLLPGAAYNMIYTYYDDANGSYVARR